MPFHGASPQGEPLRPLQPLRLPFRPPLVCCERTLARSASSAHPATPLTIPYPANLSSTLSRNPRDLRSGFVANCIGERNYRWFYGFLVSVSLLEVVGLVASGGHMLRLAMATPEGVAAVEWMELVREKRGAG